MKVECDAYYKCYITSTIDSVHYGTTSMSHSPHSTPALSAFVRYISSDPLQHSRPHGALYALCVETTVNPAAPTLPRPPQSSTAASVRPPCPSSRVVPPLLHLLKHRRRHTLRASALRTRPRRARSPASILELVVLALQKWRRSVICKQPVAHHHAPPHLHHSGDRERRLSPAPDQLTFGYGSCW